VEEEQALKRMVVMEICSRSDEEWRQWRA